MSNSIAIPAKLEDINSAWLSKILKEKISEQDFETEENVQKGSGVLCNMTRVRCKSDSKSLNLVVKLLPAEGSDEALRSFVISEGLDKTEVKFYQKIAPDLVKILPELEEYLCKFYYGQFEDTSSVHGRGSVIVLEDLKPQKYYTITYTGAMNPKQIKTLFAFLAKFHFASMVLEEEKGVRLNKMYDFLQTIDLEGNSPMYAMGQGGFISLNKTLGEKEVHPRVREAFQQLAPHSDTILKMIVEAGLKFPCLIHADIWSFNAMFTDNPEFPTKIIDWQTLCYRDPNFDLTFTIMAALSAEEMTKENVDKLLKYYYKCLVDESNKYGSNHLIKRDLEAFSEFFYTWGMAWTLILYVMFHGMIFDWDSVRGIKAFEFLIVEMNTDKFILDMLKVNK